MFESVGVMLKVSGVERIPGSSTILDYHKPLYLPGPDTHLLKVGSARNGSPEQFSQISVVVFYRQHFCDLALLVFVFHIRSGSN